MQNAVLVCEGSAVDRGSLAPTSSAPTAGRRSGTRARAGGGDRSVTGWSKTLPLRGGPRLPRATLFRRLQPDARERTAERAMAPLTARPYALHDTVNAAYWYGRAAQSVATGAIEEEWRRIAGALLSRV